MKNQLDQPAPCADLDRGGASHRTAENAPRRGPRQAVVMAVGSGGDVAPLAAAAAVLARRGLRTTLMAPSRYAGLTPPDVQFSSVGSDDVFAEVFDHADVWHPRRGLAASWRYYGAAALSSARQLGLLAGPDDTLVLSSSFAVGARLAEERRGYANVTVHLSPAVVFSYKQPPAWPNGQQPARWPLWLRTRAAATAERLLIDPVIRRAMAPARDALGMGPGPAHQLFSEWLHARRRVIHAFPAWFAPAASDWPVQGCFAGFPRAHLPAPALDDASAAWLRTARPLGVITAGTAVAQRPTWVNAVVRAGLARGESLLVIRPGAPAQPHPRVLELPHAPFAYLLPHAAWIAHHAGIGTLVEAMRAGLPQLLFPGAHDQPDNAERATGLGVARRLPGQASARAIDDALRWADAQRAAPAQLAAARQRLLAEPDGAELIADLALRAFHGAWTGMPPA